MRWFIDNLLGYIINFFRATLLWKTGSQNTFPWAWVSKSSTEKSPHLLKYCRASISADTVCTCSCSLAPWSSSACWCITSWVSTWKGTGIINSPANNVVSLVFIEEEYIFEVLVLNYQDVDTTSCDPSYYVTSHTQSLSSKLSTLHHLSAHFL